MRVLQAPGNIPFIQFLLQAGEGSLLTRQIARFSDYGRIPEGHTFDSTNATEENSVLKQFTKIIYPGLEIALLLPEDMVRRAILTPLNKDDGDNATYSPVEYQHLGPF
ncbi:hypothetical protein BGX27_008001 [Mortierella sp. AM989]|nr:hypothetical protein BGX27_008001 [Mortierella sp. AM989]